VEPTTCLQTLLPIMAGPVQETYQAEAMMKSSCLEMKKISWDSRSLRRMSRHHQGSHPGA